MKFPNISLTLYATPTHVALPTSCIYYVNATRTLHVNACSTKNVHNDLMSSKILNMGDISDHSSLLNTGVVPNVKLIFPDISLTFDQFLDVGHHYFYKLSPCHQTENVCTYVTTTLYLHILKCSCETMASKTKGVSVQQ